jgi:hypothetical protein
MHCQCNTDVCMKYIYLYDDITYLCVYVIHESVPIIILRMRVCNTYIFMMILHTYLCVDVCIHYVGFFTDEGSTVLRKNLFLLKNISVFTSILNTRD